MSRRTLGMLLVAVAGLGVSPSVRGADVPRGGGGKEEGGGELFGLDRLWEFHLKIEPDAWKEMQPPSREGFGPFGGGGGLDIDFKYVKGVLEFLGKTYGEVGVRYKGHGSYAVSSRGTKRPFKIDLDRHKKQTLAGQAKLNLANNAMDPSFLREALAYAIFRRAGVPAPRTAFVKLYLTVPGKFDRQYLGLYTLDEQVDKRFLRAHFGEADGLLLKPQNTRGLPHLGEEWSAYEKPYEPKTDAKPAPAKRLIAFTRLVNDRGEGSEEAFREQIGSFLDVDEFLKFLAVNAALANLDSFLVLGKNCYIYLDPETDKFVFIPWDLDISFGGFFMVGSAEQQADQSIGHPHAGENPLIDRLLAMPEANKAYRAHLERIVATAMRPEVVKADIETIRRTIREAVAAESPEALKRFDQSLSSEAPRADPPPPFGAPGGGPMAFPVSPIMPFLERRAESIRAQLAGKSEGVVPRFGMPGGAPGGFGAGNFLAPLVLKAADADKDGRLSPEEAAKAAEQFVRDADSAKKGSIDLNTLRDAMNRRTAPPPGFGGPGGPPGGPARRGSGERSHRQ